MANAHILVLDDDRMACHAIVRILHAGGYSADEYCNAESALRAVAEKRYDLAILDYQMPDMNGAEFLKRARMLQPQLQSIFVTAFASIDAVFPAITAGAERVLAKPPVAHDILRLVQRFIGPPRGG